jgi:hypothetical protein
MILGVWSARTKPLARRTVRPGQLTNLSAEIACVPEHITGLLHPPKYQSDCSALIKF